MILIKQCSIQNYHFSVLRTRTGECLVATRNEIWKMHVKGSVSLINILTKLIFPVSSSYHQSKIKSKSELCSTWIHHTGSVHMKWLFILLFILIISLWRIIREKEEKELIGKRRRGGGRGGGNYFAPCILGGLIRDGSSIEDLRYLQMYHLNYVGYRASWRQTK